jgi:acyl-CoA dehydrogenase
MTEPMPGAGSDPGQMLTRAERDGDGWVAERPQVVHHRRRCGRALHRRRAHLRRPRKGLTAFLFHRDTPGLEIVRRIPIMGPEEHGGHCELRFDDLRDARRATA